MADKAAKDRALAREPSPELMKAYRRTLFLLSRCLAVSAKVQEAIVTRDNAPGVFLARHKKWRPERVAHGANKRVGRPETQVPEARPAGVHELAVPDLVLDPGQMAKLVASKATYLTWPLVCQLCGDKSTGTHGWAKFSRKVCRAMGDQKPRARAGA